MAGWGDDGWGTGGDTAADSWGAGDTNNNAASDKGCRICHEEGHFARECPNKKEKKSGCFKCGEEGHNKADCPNAESGGGERKSGCFKCGEEGHNKADCPNAGEDDGEKKGCFKCGGDHMAKDCEQPDKCRNCGQEGHMSKDCEKPAVCRKCGEEGHKSNDCETGFKTRAIESVGEDGETVKREIYVPIETSEDSLFDLGIATGINFGNFDKVPVKVSGDNPPKPAETFQSMNLREHLLGNITKSKYMKPTPIQKTAIPIILAGRDLMGCAQTGSGKTAAFLLPIIHKILEDGADPHSGEEPQKPEAVVVAPTRELAIQITNEARKFANGTVVRPVVAYGGTSVGFQLSNLFKGCNILIATPGRLLDFVEKGKVSFENVKFLVLDEADRMLDMGFLPDITKIAMHSSMPKKGERRTLMFSATFPDTVQHMALDFLQDYLFLTIGIVGGASKDVTQSVFEVEKFAKREKLLDLLREVGTDKTLVFVETKRNADFLASALSGEGFPTTSIHGDRLQREREEALSDFKNGTRPILVATAVAARGLDIKGVAHVVNYDMPKDIDEYVHRIGRTGRVGNTGKATTFFDPGHDSGVAGDLTKILSDAGQEVPDFLGSDMGGFGDGGGGFGGSDIRSGQDQVQTNDDEGW